jgi:PST family polysaccharide transporter
MLIRHGGVEENGYFQAAWALCSLPVGILLNASYSEFYPEIARLSKDGGAMSNIANEYIDLSLHMFYPIAAAMVTFSQYLIALLYSEDFLFAVDTLQWLALSILFRVSSFGLTNIIHARGKALIFTLVEFIHNAAFVLLTYTMLNNQGLKATGIAFLLSQVLYFIVALSLAKREIGFKIKKRVIISMFSVCSVLFVVIYINLMNPKFALFAGTGVTVALLFKYFRYAKRMGLFSLGKFLG